MALTPTTIPTSFVPKQPVSTGQKFKKSGGNTFLVLALVVLGVALVASGAVFAYEHYLKGVRDQKAEAVTLAQQRINSASVEEFVRLRERFETAQSLLDAHVAASGFFNLLERVTLQNVRFDSLSLLVLDDKTAEITMTGVARTFNALAAQSSVLAKEKLIKRAIFSDIAADDDTDTVTFSLSADLDPRLLAFTADEAPPAPPVHEAPIDDVSDSAVPSREETEPRVPEPPAVPEQMP